MPMADVRVVGHAVSDVIHLLAELIENAAAFSPPGTRVQVSGEPTAHGYLLEVEDQGIGMPEEELREANEQLARPAAIDLASAQRLGFYVVGRLASRHSIKVRLRRSWYGGVAALVLLPSGLLGGPEATSEPAGAPLAEPALAEPLAGLAPRAFAVAEADSRRVPGRAWPADGASPAMPRPDTVPSPARRDDGMAR
jgi:hypothetical protein